MTYPKYIRERARQLRIEKKLTLDEIAQRLALPKTTVYYWIKDLPIERPKGNGWPETARRKGNRAMQEKHRLIRERAYAQGLAEYDQLALNPTFRDFVVLYIAEGYKRSRNTVAIANSDPVIIAMSTVWLRRFSDREPVIQVQYHRDQVADELRSFWSTTAGVEPERIRLYPKSNSGELRMRVWRCEHGVASVEVYDTEFRARLGAWMDRIRESWG